MTAKLMNIGHITPHILQSRKHQSLTFHVALGELCDNAFDAGASQVQIIFGQQKNRKTLQVIDDGHGCADLERMLTLGDHMHQGTTSLGRFGVGLKDAACWLWGEVSVDSVHGGVRRKAHINWTALSKQSDWTVEAPVETQTDESSGTKLTFRDIIRKVGDYNALADELGYTFAPALLGGKQIKLQFPRKKPLLCAAWQLPELAELVEKSFSVNGKSVKLSAGLVSPEVVNERSGFSICHGHRIIMNTSFGSKGYSTARIAGRIVLGDGWALGTNKNDFVDEDRPLLEDEIFTLCRHIFERAAEQAELIRSSELESKVTKSVQQALSDSLNAKAKRASPRNSTGTVQETKSGKRHRRAANTQPGDRLLSKCDIGQMRMEWRPRADNLVGSVDILGNVVYLNPNNTRMAYHRTNENADALADMCIGLLSHEHIHRSESEKLIFARDYDGFLQCWSSVLTSQQQGEAAAARAES